MKVELRRINEVKGLGAELIVVQSELGLSQNIKIAQSFEDIDVMYSAHTHEVTLGALLVHDDEVTRTTPGKALSKGERNQLSKGAAIVVETNRDMYVGRLGLEMNGGDVVDFSWEAIAVDESVSPDPAMAELVAAMEEDFVSGEDSGEDESDREHRQDDAGLDRTEHLLRGTNLGTIGE